MHNHTLAKSLSALFLTTSAISASATLVNHFTFDDETDLLASAVGPAGVAYNASVANKAPVAQTGSYTLEALEVTDGEGTAHVVKIPTGASFGFAHGVGASANNSWCIEMRVHVPTNVTGWVSFLQLAQKNDADASLFRNPDDGTVGGGSGGISYEDASVLPLGEWHTYVVSVDQGLPSLYRDGEAVECTANFNWKLTDRPVIFLAADNDGEDGDIYFDYVKVYDEARPESLGLAAMLPAEAIWMGQSTQSTCWSDAANWFASSLPTASRKVLFPQTYQQILLDGDNTVEDFFVSWGATARFFNDDPTKTNTLTVANMYMLGQGNSQVVLDGPVVFNIQKGANASYNKASVCVTNGAVFNATLLNYGDNGGQHLVAQGEGSAIKVGSIKVCNYDTNPNESLEAYNGGTVTVSDTYKPYSAHTVIATNGGTVVATKLDLSIAKAHKVTCADSYVHINKLTSTASGTTVKVGGTGYLVTEGQFTMAGSNANLLNLYLYGSDPGIYVKGNSETKFGTGSSSYKAKMTLNLGPEPTWKEGDARINKKNGTSAKFTLSNYVKFNVDCSGFANYYGKRRMALFMNGANATSTFNAPTTYLYKTGTGADKCAIAFDKTVASFHMTITSTNALPPETAVAGVNNAGKATVFYDTLEAAVAAAAAAEADEVDVVVVKDAVLDGKLTAGKPVKIYALDPVTLTGTVDAESVTLGENITLVSGVAFTVPEIDHATVVVSNDNQQLEAPYRAMPGTDVIVTYQTEPGYLFSDGRNTKTVTVSAAEGELTTGVSGADIAPATVQIGAAYYLTLADAFEAAADGDTVTLLADMADAQASLSRAVAITLDLNGKTMNCTTPKDPNNWYGFTIRVNAGQLTIDDTVGGGKILNNNDDSALRCCAPSGGEAACPKLIVKAGTFENNSQESGTIYVGPTAGAVIEIEGGTFKNNYVPFAYGNASAVLNVHNSMAGQTPMIVKGGTFSVDPSLGDDAIGLSYLPSGYYSVQQGDVWVVTDEPPVRAFILTIVKGEGVTSVTTNGVAVTEVEAQEGDVVTFSLTSDYTVPVYSNGSEVVRSSYAYTVTGAATLTFTAAEGGDNLELPATVVNEAIVDAVQDPADKTAVAAQVAAIEAKTNPNTGSLYTANEVAAWIKNQSISFAAMARSAYTQSSIALDTGLLDGSEVKVSQMTAGEAIEIKVGVNGETVKAKGIEGMIQLCGDLSSAEWGSASEKAALVGSVQVDKITGSITITSAAGVPSLFIRVLIPADR